MQIQSFQIPVPPNASLKKVEPPAIERLQEIHVPTLVIVDAFDVPEFVMLAAQVAAFSRLFRSDGWSAHLLGMEALQLFNEKVIAFLATHA